MLKGGDAPAEGGSAPADGTEPVGRSGVRVESKDDAMSSAPTLHASPGGVDASNELAPGTILDGVYRVEKRIGRGAMGTVYLVEHVRLGRRFAAKVVSERHAQDGDVALRLRNEARVASRIQHENIVDVTHLGSTPTGALFIVMELLQGRDLREEMVSRREKGLSAHLPDDELRAIASDVMNGLAAAHGEQIVHRDLKPDNVFLVQKDGRTRAKIVDFGISKSQQGDEDLRLTRTGQIIGTPLYMAPEQSKSTSQVDARADVYSLGVMLYELATGRLPFEATNLYEIIVQHATEPPRPLRELRADLPASVDRVVRKCLAKAPADRWQTIDELHEAWDRAWREPGAFEELDASLARLPAVSLPSPSAPRSPLVPAVIGGLVLALVAVVAWAATRPPDVVSPAPVAAPPAPVVAAPAAPEPDRASDPAPPDPAPTDPGPAAPAPIVRRVVSVPPGATVLRDGVELGTTPQSIELQPGASARIELRMRGHDAVTRTVAEADPEEITVTLRRRRTGDRTPELAPR